MGAAASSSSSSAIFRKIYDVFLSFRGEDTRKTFTSHLHTALCMSGIRTYIDYELPKGDDISEALIQAIQDSSISVVIFSENYASSKWCLNELVKILECKEGQGQLVIPIFYQVDPSHVRNQKGTYQEAFEKHFTQNPEKVNKWKRALFETASLAGWDSRICRDESLLIRNIVSDILKRLDHMYPSTVQGLVGIEENADCIESLLENVSTIGIWGMGGIGKTTIAKAVFTKLSFQFENCCFFENLREESEIYGLKYIRDKLLRELLKEEESMVGSTFAMRRLSCKKVFIVLDDVNNIKQLEYLAKGCHSLGPGSKVIITTRDKHLLLGRVNEIYEAKPLSYYKSVSLFNLKAFHKDNYESGYKELSERVVAYAKGNPLVLITLGSFLYSKTIGEWESALTRLEKTTHEDIHAVLKLSYDGLNFEEREMFLEIACFLKGEFLAKVVALLDSYGYHARIGLRSLVDKALICLSNNYVDMHDLIQQMGREIVHQECMKDPGRRSRLWNPNEIYDVLKNNQVTDAVEGISLDLSQIGDVCLTSNTLKKMTNLRFLKFYSSAASDRRSCVNIPSSLESFSNSLCYLEWDNFPSEALPLSFCAEKLVELNMKDSKLKKLWDGTQDLVNLRRLNLDFSKQLVELPDFSKAQNLEGVSLFSCESLCHLHPSILSLHRLKYLQLSYCINMKDLQSESHLKSLESLSVDTCYSLKEFSISSESMRSLDLHRTGIESLGSSIGRLEKLSTLKLNCSRLKNIPVNQFYALRSLEELFLYECGEIIDESRLHILFDALQSLRSFYLGGSCILTELPNNIRHLSRLEFLLLMNCKSLQSLPELPPSIKDLTAINCTSLKTLTLTSHAEFPLLPQQIMQHLKLYSSIRYLRNLRRLILLGCNEENHSLSHIMAFAYFFLKRGVHTNQMVYACYPGRKVSDCFKHNQTTKAPYFITIELSSATNKLQGFIFYSVVPQFTPKENCAYRLKCLVYDEDGVCGVGVSIVINNVIFEINNVNSQHVFLWTAHKNILTKYQEVNYKSKLSFEFCVIAYDRDDFLVYGFMNATKHDDLIEACGVCPIYAPDYHNFLQQMELELETKEQTAFDDIEEHSFRGILEYAIFSLKQATYGDFERSIIPEWFAYKSLTAESSVFVQLNPSIDGLLGFIFCFVIPEFSLKERDQYRSSCGYYDEDNIYQEGPGGWHYLMIQLNSNNVFLWYDPLYCELILENIQNKTGTGESGKYKSKVTFEFKFGDCLIKECGVRPIYASEYRVPSTKGIEVEVNYRKKEASEC